MTKFAIALFVAISCSAGWANAAEYLEKNDMQKARAFSPAVIAQGGKTVYMAGQTTLAAAHVGAAVVHGVDRDELSALAVLDREARGRDIAHGLCVVVALAQARHLQLQFVLIRPEPGHRIIGLRLAEQRGCHGLCLID